MHKYQYKEKDHALEIINNGFLSKHINSELKILSKYYNEQGKNEKEIKTLLHEFCKNHLKGFNEAIHFKIINDAVKFGLNKRNKLIQIDKVNISKKELDCIEKMDIIHDYKRVVFSLLVLTKLGKEFLKIRDGELRSKEYYFGGHKSYRELVKVSKIVFNKRKKSKVKNIHDLIHILDEKGIVKITSNGNIKLLFMYDIEEDNEVVFSVDNYEVIGYFYDLHYGENRVKRCDECKIPIKMKSNRQEYCDSCWNKIRQGQNRENFRKWYEKQLSNQLEK